MSNSYPENPPYPDYRPAGQSLEEFEAEHASDYEGELGPDYDPEPPARKRSRRNKIKRQRRRRRNIALLVVFGLFAGALVGVVLFLQNLLGMNDLKDYPGPGEGEVSVTVEQGAGPLAIASALMEQDVVASSDKFIDELANQADGREVQPGDYKLKRQMKAADAAGVLLAQEEGVNYAAINRTWRQQEVFEALSKGTGIAVSEFETLAKDPAAFGLPDKARNLDGYLFPAEYRFPLEATAEDILTTMIDNTFERLEKDGITDPNQQYDVLTVASIIEAEAGEADYGAVAGAIENRLKPDNTETNGFIQSDATVTYGLGRKGYDITPEEKADTDNPYNTYAHTGLPVGPINSPGGPAIDAAANPDDVPYYYWVTVNLDTGETKFSETLEEHNAYTKEYLKWCSEQDEGRCD